MSKRRNEVAIVIHLHYLDVFPQLVEILAPMADKIDFYFSVRQGALAVSREMIREVFADAVVVSYENSGRDVLPFIRIYNVINGFGYKAICKLHGKKSLHRVDGEKWRNEVFNSLAGSQETIYRHVERLQEVDSQGLRVGVIGPAGHVLDGKSYWSQNKAKTSEYGRRFGCKEEWFDNFSFVAGTMFWFHPDALAPLLLLELQTDDFDKEEGQVDGTLAHAVERLIGLSCIRAGMLLEDSNGGADAGRLYEFAAATVTGGRG